MYIDLGTSSREETLSLGVDVGSPLVLRSSVERMSNSDLVYGGALDNRLGGAVLLQFMRELDPSDLLGEVVAVVTVQEEVGLRGAAVAAHRVRPDLALALDTVPAGGTPDLQDSVATARIGVGPVFCLVTGRAGRGMIVPSYMRDLLIRSARAAGQSYQLMIMDGGNNDAAAIQLAGQGTPAASIGVPRRYSHSPVEMAHLDDAVAAVKILLSFVREMGQAGMEPA